LYSSVVFEYFIKFQADSTKSNCFPHGFLALTMPSQSHPKKQNFCLPTQTLLKPAPGALDFHVPEVTTMFT